MAKRNCVGKPPMLVVAHDAGLLRIPGEWSDHGTTNYKHPPVLMGRGILPAWDISVVTFS